MSWREQVWENLKDLSSFNFQDELLKIVPEKLYRYRIDEECKLKELQDSTVYLANPKSFNDPFESAYAKDFEYVLKRLKKKHNVLSELDKKKLAKTFNRIMNHPDDRLAKDLRYSLYKTTLEKHQDMFRIACFCESPKDHLMWAHYASNHKGFCIEYDSKSILSNLLLNTNFFPVLYQDKLPKLPHEAFSKTSYWQYRLSVTKNSCWEYENEWRLIFPTKSLPPKEDFHLTITRVFLGVNIDQDFRNKIEAICTSKGIECTELALSDENYELINKFSIELTSH